MNSGGLLGVSIFRPRRRFQTGRIEGVASRNYSVLTTEPYLANTTKEDSVQFRQSRHVTRLRAVDRREPNFVTL
jgi:hypothetical protein